jgi:hypothetical protein
MWKTANYQGLPRCVGSWRVDLSCACRSICRPWGREPVRLGSPAGAAQGCCWVVSCMVLLGGELHGAGWCAAWWWCGVVSCMVLLGGELHGAAGW